ncbi:hypothetical protein [Acidovorax radicis]|uniref:hypothetical protein n=1 Tax=Acidovorax radicis TaxID=758826 RepID=UPI001CFB3C38|nr:hypothetical protein [Acidovorax radicis]UCV01028.1 hypothetical protein KI609_10005 [Acidovorax radicis]
MNLPLPFSPAPAPAQAALPLAPAVNLAVDIKALYHRVRAVCPPGQWVTAFHLGNEHTLMASGMEATSPSIMLTLALGRLKTARDFFRSDLPTPLELETAIAEVEDEVYAAHVRHRLWVPQGALVVPYAADPALHDLATLAGVAAGAQRLLTIDAVERLFNRLTAVSQGRPAAHEGLPASAAFAAALLVLRELMHHMPFKTLVLLPPADVATHFE